MTITLGTVVNRSDGKSQVSFSQSAAATSDILVADPGDGARIILDKLYIVIGTTGTILLDGLTGAFVANAGVEYVIEDLEVAESTALGLTTVTGAAKGFIVYDILGG